MYKLFEVNVMFASCRCGGSVVKASNTGIRLQDKIPMSQRLEICLSRDIHAQTS